MRQFRLLHQVAILQILTSYILAIELFLDATIVYIDHSLWRKEILWIMDLQEATV